MLNFRLWGCSKGAVNRLVCKEHHAPVLTNHITLHGLRGLGVSQTGQLTWTYFPKNKVTHIGNPTRCNMYHTICTQLCSALVSFVVLISSGPSGFVWAFTHIILDYFTGTLAIVCLNASEVILEHDDVIKWKHFPCYWPFVLGIHRSPVNSPHKGQWRGPLCFLWSVPEQTVE